MKKQAKAECASSAKHSNTWKEIDFSKYECKVRKLQIRIAKTQKKKRYNKVRSLQHLLVTSYEAKTLAVKKVTSNKGKRTAEIDHILWDTDAKKVNAVCSLKRRGYRALSLKRINIAKKNGKMRPLGIPTMRDRAMQALYLMALDPIAETTGDQHSYGFRKYRSCQDAIAQCHNVLSRDVAPKWVLEGDIKGCFDHISHEWLLNNIPMDREVLRKWLKCGFVFNGELFPTEEGTPQGGIISPTLANMTLDGLQSLVQKAVKPHWEPADTKYGRKWIEPKINLVRYADDFIVTAKDKETIETVLLPLIRQFMAERGLMLSEEKTKVTHVSEGFDFLGFNIREYKSNGKLLTKPSKDAMKNFCDKVRTKIKSNKSAKASSLIRMLNHMIPGWTNYYRYGASSKAFSRVDYEVYKTLWQWAQRRHPKKGKQWIKERYFKQLHGREWCFAAITKNKKSGKETTLSLKRLADTPILKYVRIRTNTNPYDPADAPYYARRKSKNTEEQLREIDDLLRMIWVHQEMRCPVCGEIIDDERKWTTIKKTINGKPFKILVHSSCKNKKFNPDKISRK